MKKQKKLEKKLLKQEFKVSPAKTFKGEIYAPSDKSISHRSVLISSLALGKSEICNFLFAEDCLNTIKVLQKLGISIVYKNGKNLTVEGKGLLGFKEPTDILDFGNSGTGLRITSGILAGQNFLTILTGDDSLRKRPIKRIILPLEKMGAKLFARDNNQYPPLVIKGGKLKSIVYSLPVPSAQVKSCILLASLFVEGKTKISEPVKSRDHTERMLKFFDVQLEEKGLKISILGRPKLKAKKIFIPGDLSNSAFFIVAATILEKAHIVIKDVGLNETRTDFLTVLKKMGADINIYNQRKINNEEIGDLEVKSSELKGIELKGEIIPKIIDEIPILALAASLAKGETIIKEAQELRVKETDRIKAMVINLRKLGVKVEEFEDGLQIFGKEYLKGNKVNSFKDHRIAMTMIIAGLKAKGETTVIDTNCINTSFPDFIKIINKLRK